MDNTTNILLSAFQKDIRRCNPNCLYWTKELSNIDVSLVWKKFHIIGSEDIGIASPYVQTFIKKQKTDFYNSTNIWQMRTILINTSNFLIHQNKSRLCDNVNHAYFKNYQPIVESREFSILFDNFISAINDHDHRSAFLYASHLYKMNKEDVMIDILRIPIDEHADILIELFHTYNLSESRGRTDILFLSHLILYRTFDLTKIQLNPEIKPLEVDDVKQLYSEETLPKYGDYVFDKHTDIGHKLGRDFEHFYNEGAKLVNCYLDDPYEEIAKKIIL